MDCKTRRKCSICGKEFEGWGNNAQPVNDGVCCDECNADVVIPRRLKEVSKAHGADKITRLDAAEFIVDFLDIKNWYIKEAILGEAKHGRKVYKEEFQDKLYEQTSEKFKALFKKRMTQQLFQKILIEYTDFIIDDLDLFICFYFDTTGEFPNIIGINID